MLDALATSIWLQWKAVNMSLPSITPFKIRGRNIRLDEQGRVCLNDIHLAGGFSKNQTPHDWGRSESAKSLMVTVLEKSRGKSPTFSKTDVLSVYCVKMGRGGGVWAHPNLALAYAKYLSPELHYEVNEVFLRYKAGDAVLADDILQRAPAKDNEWAGIRALSRSTRTELTSTLQSHDVTKPLDFAKVTNATYGGLWNKTAKQIKSEKGLKPTANLRDAMKKNELVFVMAAEQLAKERIEDENARGVSLCSAAATKSASFIRQAIEADRADRKKK